MMPDLPRGSVLALLSRPLKRTMTNPRNRIFPFKIYMYWVMFFFPRTAIINYHKLDGLDHQKFIVSVVLGARSPKSRCWLAWFCLRAGTEPRTVWDSLLASGDLRHSLALRWHSPWVFTSSPFCTCLSLCLNIFFLVSNAEVPALGAALLRITGLIHSWYTDEKCRFSISEMTKCQE